MLGVGVNRWDEKPNFRGWLKSVKKRGDFFSNGKIRKTSTAKICKKIMIVARFSVNKH